jgi:multicomponent K+:H+ antiporter subunit D
MSTASPRSPDDERADAVIHLIALPVLLPAFVAALILLFRKHTLRIGRAVSVASTAMLALSGSISSPRSSDGAVTSYALGNWPAPFGIVLVLDRLSALMLLLTAVLALIVLWHAIADRPRPSRLALSSAVPFPAARASTAPS